MIVGTPPSRACPSSSPDNQRLNNCTQTSLFLHLTYTINNNNNNNNNKLFNTITEMSKPSKSPKHTKVSSSISSIPPYAVATAAEMDRKVYIPLCFCLISFAVMVYVN